MAGFDYGEISRGIFGGLQAGQRFRANRQQEKLNDQTLESNEYDLERRRADRRTRDPENETAYGPLDPSTVTDYEGLGDPFAIRLFDFFKKRRQQKRAAQGIPVAPEDVGPSRLYSGPTATTVEPPVLTEPGAPMYADGGAIKDLSPEEIARLKKTLGETVEADAAGDPKARRNAEIDQLSAQLAASRAAPGQAYLDRTDAAAKREPKSDFQRFEGAAINSVVGPEVRARNRASNQQFWGEAKETAGRAMNALGIGGGDEAVAAAAPAPRQAIPVAAPAAPAAAPAAASPARRQAVPTAAPAPAAQGQDTVDFSDVDPKEVPNMQMDDWKKYRLKLMDNARLSGRPEEVAKVNDMVTSMQQKGFINYGQQGLALQQAGNVKGAMAAYRAAFQYFPNGNDVEFGMMRNKQTNRLQIIGFGRDEKTGKVVPGSELVMDPERVSTMIENFRNPNAFRAWTKDWRDEQFKERTYQEVTKPVAQAQVTASANNTEANILRAENAGLRASQQGAGGGYKQSDMRGDASLFRNVPQVQELSLTDPAAAQQLAAVMGQVKVRFPGRTPDEIAAVVLRAQQDGTLAEKLQKMGIQ